MRDVHGASVPASGGVVAAVRSPAPSHSAFPSAMAAQAAASVACRGATASRPLPAVLTPGLLLTLLSSSARPARSAYSDLRQRWLASVAGQAAPARWTDLAAPARRPCTACQPDRRRRADL